MAFVFVSSSQAERQCVEYWLPSGPLVTSGIVSQIKRDVVIMEGRSVWLSDLKAFRVNVLE